MSLKIVRTVAEHRAQIAAWRREGARVALTPTMGALHDGHLSLVGMARRVADRAVATIFVNPTQFGAGEDLATYPRNEARDASLLAEAGCDMLFAPPLDEVYPPGFATEVRVRGLTECLCGAARPGHMDGVAQVVTKLLNQAGADFAIFGEKDWQQLAVIRRLARDLDIPTEILGAPILREADGLAMSSRNRYLTAEERAIAPALHRALSAARAKIARGQPLAEACAAGGAAVLAAGFAKLDYFEARHGESLAPLEAPDPAGRLFAAAHLGHARLIDNVKLGAGE
ncbi:MAG: pantoate--beta-alanine ligase [Pseudomonadota bacterium]